MLALGACSSGPTEDETSLAPPSDDSEATATTAPDTSAVATSVAGEASNISTTPRTEIGSASTGRTITNPIPWDPGTIYIDDATPEFFELDINPPDPDCVAAEATATVGRGGAILLSVFIDGDHVPGAPCLHESGNNRLPLTIDEPLAGRRIYTDSSVYDGESAAGEQLSDEVIGLELHDAIAVIDDAGFQSEVIPEDPDGRESIFVAERINLYLAADGTVEFATPG